MITGDCSIENAQFAYYSLPLIDQLLAIVKNGEESKQTKDLKVLFSTPKTISFPRDHLFEYGAGVYRIKTSFDSIEMIFAIQSEYIEKWKESNESKELYSVRTSNRTSLIITNNQQLLHPIFPPEISLHFQFDLSQVTSTISSGLKAISFNQQIISSSTIAVSLRTQLSPMSLSLHIPAYALLSMKEPAKFFESILQTIKILSNFLDISLILSDFILLLKPNTNDVYINHQNPLAILEDFSYLFSVENIAKKLKEFLENSFEFKKTIFLLLSDRELSKNKWKQFQRIWQQQYLLQLPITNFNFNQPTHNNNNNDRPTNPSYNNHNHNHQLTVNQSFAWKQLLLLHWKQQVVPRVYPELYTRFRLSTSGPASLTTSKQASSSAGFCIVGKPGTGKTTFAIRYAQLINNSNNKNHDHRITVLRPKLSQILGSAIGETETQILSYFAEAKRLAPSILIWDSGITRTLFGYSSSSTTSTTMSVLLRGIDDIAAWNGLHSHSDFSQSNHNNNNNDYYDDDDYSSYYDYRVTVIMISYQLVDLPHALLRLDRLFCVLTLDNNNHHNHNNHDIANTVNSRTNNNNTNINDIISDHNTPTVTINNNNHHHHNNTSNDNNDNTANTSANTSANTNRDDLYAIISHYVYHTLHPSYNNNINNIINNHDHFINNNNRPTHTRRSQSQYQYQENIIESYIQHIYQQLSYELSSLSDSLNNNNHHNNSHSYNISKVRLKCKQLLRLLLYNC
jgi:hypothetical protein